MTPAVSIVVPVYKAEAYLDQCVQSLTDQSLRDIEVILVDDGSPDACPAMCDAWAQRDGRITVIHSPNQGPGQARNLGIDAARGEFVAFIDSDDWVLPHMMRDLVQAAREAHADVVLSGFSRVVGGSVTSTFVPCQQPVRLQGSECLRALACMVGKHPAMADDIQVPISAAFGIYRLATLRSHGLRFAGRPIVNNEDFLFNIQVYPVCSCVVALPRAYYQYRLNPASVSLSHRGGLFQSFERVWQLASAHIAQAGDSAFAAEMRLRSAHRVITEALSLISVEVHTNPRNPRPEIAAICGSAILQQALAVYPARALGAKHMIVAALMRRRRTLLLQLLFTLTKKR